MMQTNRSENWNPDDAKLEYELGKGRDAWVPASGGKEAPIIKNGKWYLYCFNHKRRQHAYLDLDSDSIITNDEARSAGLL